MSREKALPIALRVVGASLFALPAAFVLFPAEFRWAPYHPPYERMIAAIYMALGFCMWRAARDPVRHVLLIDFVIVSSILHAAVMTYDAIVQPNEHAHLWGDVPLLYVTAAFFWWLRPSERAPAPA